MLQNSSQKFYHIVVEIQDADENYFQVDLYIHVGYPLNLLGGKQDTGKKNLLKLFYVTYWIGNFIISETFQILLI